MKFCEKIVRLRKIKGLTQDEFASAVGVSRQAVYKWECGQSYPEVPKLLEIKLLFNISIDDLLDESFEIALPEKKKRKRNTQPKPQAPKAEPAKVEEAPVVEEPAKVEETPVVEEPAKVEDAPVVEEPAKIEETPVVEEPVTVEEAPVVEEPVTVEEAPTVEESVTVEEAPTVEESVTVEEAPTVEESVTAETEKKKGGFFSKLFGRK